MISALSLITSKWGRIAVELLGVVIIAAGCALYFYEKGKHAGAQEVTAQIQQSLEKQWQQTQTAIQGVKDIANSAIAAADKSRKDADNARAAAEVRLADLQGKQKAGQAAVDALKPTERHGYTVTKLALRQPGDNTACYTADEEYAIAQAVTDLPNCRAQLAEAGQKSAAQDQQTASSDTLNSALKPILGQLDTLNGRLDQIFVQRDNLQPVKVRSWACLKLWRCGTKKMQVNK